LFKRFPKTEKHKISPLFLPILLSHTNRFERTSKTISFNGSVIYILWLVSSSSLIDGPPPTMNIKQSPPNSGFRATAARNKTKSHKIPKPPSQYCVIAQLYEHALYAKVFSFQGTALITDLDDFLNDPNIYTQSHT
jgi:hypothetical protein